jgi:hypothetical protein
MVNISIPKLIPAGFVFFQSEENFNGFMQDLTESELNNLYGAGKGSCKGSGSGSKKKSKSRSYSCGCGYGC